MKSESQKVVIRKGWGTLISVEESGELSDPSPKSCSHKYMTQFGNKPCFIWNVYATAVLLINQIRQVTMIQTHCNWNSDAATAFLLVLITTWHDRVTWCCKVAVTEIKPLRTSYLSYRHRNLCWPSQGSAIVAAAGVCLTPFASHKSALYPNERLAVILKV